MDSRVLRSMVFCGLLIVLVFLLKPHSGLADTGESMSNSFAKVVPSDMWLFNNSLKLPVEQTYPKTYLVSLDDGTVQAWRKTSNAEVWSFKSGRPLVSFTWSATGSAPAGEEDDPEELEYVNMDPEQWYVEAPEVSFEEDGTLSVRDAVNTKRTLNITLEEMRQGSVHVRIGELIQVDRHSSVFMVDVETGAIVQEVGTMSQEKLNLELQKQTIFLIRTDYVVRASNLSGSLLWSLSYGEIGTLVTGLQDSAEDVASLSLLPKRPTTSPGVPYRIASTFKHPAAILTGQRLPSKPVQPSLPAGAQPAALPYLPAPAPSPSKATSAFWAELEAPREPAIFYPAPGMLPPPKPASKIVAVYTSVAGLMIMAILGLVAKMSIPAKISPVPPVKKKKPRKSSPSSPSQVEIAKPPLQESPALLRGSRSRLLDKYGSGTQVGRLFVSSVLIGSGSNGTLVLEGFLDDRKVAVKRLLAQYYEKAEKEISLLIASDEHPNVVRYYAMEQTTDFVYVSLERCSFSLYDLILAQTSQGQGMETQVKESLAEKGLNLRCVEDFNLWDDAGRPSTQLFQIMRDIVAGLAHLHALGIVHRDLKPHNVLISSGRIMQAKIADMGLSKQLIDDAVSFDNMTGQSSGSRGWQAPEQLLNKRGSRAMDIFSLGCVLYYCVTGGKHPFGSLLERDGNIAYGKMDLFHIIDNPEATDLVERLLDPDPSKRPIADDILCHPFFWDAEKSLSFLKDASDRVELDMKEPPSVMLADVETLEPVVLCGGWDGKLEPSLLHNIRGYRKYNFKSTRDLLRVIRNKAGHFREMPESLQLVIGPVPEGLYEYFRTRFPRLLIEIYQVIGYHCKSEPSFEKYYAASYTPKFTPPT